MVSKVQADDVEDPPEDAAGDATSDSGYRFEGFNVEFSEKIGLTPAGPAPKTAVKEVGSP